MGLDRPRLRRETAGGSEPASDVAEPDNPVPSADHDVLVPFWVVHLFVLGGRRSILPAVLLELRGNAHVLLILFLTD